MAAPGAPAITSISSPLPGRALIVLTPADATARYFTVEAVKSGNSAGMKTVSVGSNVLLLGLDVGGDYSFKATAINSDGSSAVTTASVILSDTTTAPSAPTWVAADLAVNTPDPATINLTPTVTPNTSLTGAAQVFWDIPTGTGNAPLRGFRITSSPGGISVVVQQIRRSTTISGLSNGTAYTFNVTALNMGGKESTATTSNSVTPAAGATLTAPLVGPTGLAATNPATGTARLSFTKVPLASNGGKHIYEYQVITSGGPTSKTVTGRPTQVNGTMTIDVTGLAAGTYTLTIRARNMYGLSSPASISSVAVT